MRGVEHTRMRHRRRNKHDFMQNRSRKNQVPYEARPGDRPHQKEVRYIDRPKRNWLRRLFKKGGAAVVDKLETSYRDYLTGRIDRVDIRIADEEAKDEAYTGGLTPLYDERDILQELLAKFDDSQKEEE